MNSKQITGIAMMAVVFGLILSPTLASNQAEAKLAKADLVIQGDLTAPSGDKPFGGKMVGEYYISVRGDQTSITTFFNTLPSPGTVYEGWLVDVDSGEKTSIGIFKDYTQGPRSILHTNVMNSFNNDLIVITEEPLRDTDPAPNTPVGGAVLEKAFGQ